MQFFNDGTDKYEDEIIDYTQQIYFTFKENVYE